MQYGVYSTFRSWWVGRKEELERSVEKWSIVIAKVGGGESSQLSTPCVLLLIAPLHLCEFPAEKVVSRRLQPTGHRVSVYGSS